MWWGCIHTESFLLALFENRFPLTTIFPIHAPGFGRGVGWGEVG